MNNVLIELLLLKSNIWKHLTVSKQINSGSLKNNVTYKLFVYKSYIYEIIIKINNFILVFIYIW